MKFGMGIWMALDGPKVQTGLATRTFSMLTLGSYLGRKINMLIEETIPNTQAYKSQHTAI